MPNYSPEATLLLEQRDQIAEDLAAVTRRWNSARASGANPTETQSLTTRMAGLNQRLGEINTELELYEIQSSH